MARIYGHQGWLLYVGQMGDTHGAFSGDVQGYTLDFHTETVDVTSMGSLARQIVPVRANYAATFDLGSNLRMNTRAVDAGTLIWEELEQWTGMHSKQDWPVDVAALMKLAERHHEEYEQLKDEEVAARFHFVVRQKGRKYTVER